MGGKVAGAVAAVALSSASASIVGVVYSGVVSVGYDFHGVANRTEVADRAQLRTGVVPDATNVDFGPVADSPGSRTSGCRDGAGTGGGCFVVFPSPDLKFTFFGHTVSLPAKWYNYDWGDDLYRVDQQPFLALFNEPGRVLNKNDPDKTGQEDAATVVGNEGLSNETQIPDNPILADADPIYDPNVINEAQSGPTPNEGAQSLIPSVATGPTTTIPEPSTWTMIIAGFAGLAFARLARREPRSHKCGAPPSG